MSVPPICAEGGDGTGEELGFSTTYFRVHANASPRHLEIAAGLEQPANSQLSDAKLDLVGARTLGSLLLDPLLGIARADIVSQLSSCNAIEDVYQLVRFYAMLMLNLPKSHETPYYYTDYDGPSQSSIDHVRECYKSLLQGRPQDYLTARRQALVRDGFRCMLSGMLDITHRAAVRTCDSEPTDLLRCCYILPPVEAVGHSDVAGDPREEHLTNAWTMLERFGFPHIKEQLCGANVHPLENVMTLGPRDATPIREDEATSQAHLHNIKLAPTLTYANLRLKPDAQVQFVAREDLPLPNPEYLRIRATCCRIAHISGAAQYADEVLRDMEDISVLAQDGSHAHVVMFTLEKLQSLHRA
ncbi:hypothetical protein BV20DRAFT_1057101 [Pilatotrama ljubarskyi]|nr:hypothetical protein BV20DRAFT_1057101 [Pilatotrama ljubarskyi]